MTLLFSSKFGIFQHRNFAFYLAARVLATIAVQMQSVAIGWQIYEITRDVFDLGLVGLAQFAPFLLLILIAGHAADRYDRRIIITLCFGMQMLCGILLLAFTLNEMKVVWPVFGVLVLFGSARAFMMPASQAILINMVPTESFGKAVALSSSSFHVAVIVGPILGGLLYLVGPKLVYGIVVILLMISVLLMLRTRLMPQVANREFPSWYTLLEGVRFVWSKPIVLGAISLDLFAVLFGGATALLPAYANDVLHAGPAALGILRTAPGIGAVLISIILAFWPISRRVGCWMFGGVAIFGIGVLVLGKSHNLPIAITALVLMGAGDMVSVYIRHILVQFETPDAIRGRVSAVNAVFIGASNELGEFESGITAGWFGLVRALLFGGAATLAVTGIWAWLFPSLSLMDHFPQVKNSLVNKSEPSEVGKSSPSTTSAK